MDSLANLDKGFLTAIVCGILLEHVIAPALKLDTTPCKGLPKWNYLATTTQQIVVYVPVVVMAWKSMPSTQAWLEDGWETRGIYDYIFYYAITFQMMKDMWAFRKVALMFAHHIVCLFGVYVFQLLPAGIGIITFGTCCMEIGSAAYNLECVYPGKFTWWYCIMITLSTIVGLPLSFYFWQVGQRENMQMHWLVFVVAANIILNVLRQEKCIKHCRAAGLDIWTGKIQRVPVDKKKH